jgi:hypothetical protein
MKRLRAILALAAFAAGVAQAQEAGVVRWKCWYEREPAQRVACRLVEVAAPAGEQVPAPQWMEGLPPMVKRIRSDPASLANEVVAIPLYSPPIDMRQTARLARGVMCGARAGCEVEFSAAP